MFYISDYLYTNLILKKIKLIVLNIFFIKMEYINIRELVLPKDDDSRKA